MRSPVLFASRRVAALAALCIQAALPSISSSATSSSLYSVIDLGSLGGDSGAYSIAPDNRVAGFGLVGPSLPHAVVFGVGSPSDLGTLGGDASLARALNGSGDVVGWSRLASGDRHAFVAHAGKLEDLGTLGGHTSDAFDINEDGAVVGTSALDGDESSSGFIWTRASGLRPVITFGSGSQALSLNNHNEVVGFSQISLLGLHAFLWKDGESYDLGTLPDGGDSKAYSINDQGVIVGFAQTKPPFTFHAVRWDGGVIRDLGALPGRQSVAYDINARGEIIGFSYTAALVQVATRFDENHVTDLNTLIPAQSGWVLNSAFSINDNGAIVGIGTLSGQRRAFLLVPSALSGVGTDAPRTELSLHVHPQPARSQMSFVLDLPSEASDVRLALYDLSGRLVQEIARGRYPAGRSTLAYSISDKIASMGPGLYFARLESSGRTVTRQVVIIH